MKKFLVSVFLAAAMAATVSGTEYRYSDARDFLILGKITPDTFGPYTRFPESMKEGMRNKVWDLGLCSAGICVRFSSDAGEFSARWATIGRSLGDNMTYVMKSGMALYVLDKGEWVYVNAFRPGNVRPGGEKREFTVKCSRLEGQMHEYMLYLGMYDGFQSVEIGVPEGRRMAMPTVDSPRASYPVIAYGTSILQGASASHPGLAGTNLLGRMLDRQVINLGFSGNALLDYDVAEYMASYPTPGAYIIDNGPNGTPQLTREKLEGFYRILRNAHPDTPVFFVGMPLYPRVRFDAKGREHTLARREAILDVFGKLKKSGEKNIYYVDSDRVLSEDNIGTVEGTHYTDIAFERWAEALVKAMKGRIKAKAPLRLSIIGDSISTFEEMIPDGNRVYREYVRRGCLENWSNTYWGRLITRYQPSSLVFEKNISLSGSCVACDHRQGKKYRASFVQRYGKDGNVTGRPDIVLIYGGTNDNTLKLPDVLETPSEAAFKEMFAKPVSELDTLSFAQSYVKLIRMVHKDCPKAKVLCVIGDYVCEAQKATIGTVASNFPFVETVDFSNGGKPNPLISKVAGCHPDAAGMDYMASVISARLEELGWLGK